MKCKIVLVCQREIEDIVKKLDGCFCDLYDESPCPKCKSLYKNLTDIENLLDYYGHKETT